MGSLIKLVQSDPSDIFLTGNPTITYFRTVFRRHTNFSLELKEEKFNNNTGFGLKSSLNIPKNADLIHRLYLKVKIPKIYIPKTITSEEQELINNLKEKYIKVKTQYDYLKKWISYNYSEYKIITNYYNILKSIQTLTIQEMLDNLNNWYQNIDRINYSYNSNYGNSDYNINKLVIDPDFNKYINTKFNYPESKQYFIYNSTTGNICLYALQNYMSTIINSMESFNYIEIAYNRCKYYIEKTKQLDYFFYSYVQSIKEELDKLNVNRHYFAWVDKLGHSIIDYTEITIGGQSIDKQYGFWLDVWHELNKNIKNEDYYNKLIGNIPLLTEYNTEIKPEYILYIPLNFWFCKYEALSLPIISLQYTDIIFHVQFRKFSECAYSSLKYEYSDDPIENEKKTNLLDNVLISQNKDLEASLLIEYVYLDNAERRLFAKSSHEYLIEQTQIQQINDIDIIKKDVQLNFVHPCKGFIWFAQFTDKYMNNDNINKCLWTNYQFTTTKLEEYIENGKYKQKEIIIKTNPFKNAELTIEGRLISQNLSNLYYNYVIPWNTFKNTPADGINTFWFSIKPNEIQPSGFCNISYLREFKLAYKIDMDEEYIRNRPYTLTILTLNYNILRISSGLSSLAYV